MITTDFDCFGKAYDYFNENLFEGKLPAIVFVLTNKPKSLGHFAFERFKNREGFPDKKASELSLNHHYFRLRSDIEILSTLVHEMVHCQQCYFFNPPRAGYHDKEWAELMDEIGLTPSSTGEYGGKRTGQKMSHLIEADGKFERIATTFLLNNKLEWETVAEKEKEKKDKKKSAKFIYTCPGCFKQITSKEEVRVVCVEDGVEYVMEGDKDEN
jgi:predicted SprT family Zn-dependent metalloprotease